WGVALRHARAHDVVAEQDDAGSAAVVAAEAGIEAVFARDAQAAVAPARVQAVQCHAVVEELQSVALAQLTRVRDGVFAQPQCVVPPRGNEADGQKRQPDFQHVTILARYWRASSSCLWRQWKDSPENAARLLHAFDAHALVAPLHVHQPAAQ